MAPPSARRVELLRNKERLLVSLTALKRANPEAEGYVVIDVPVIDPATLILLLTPRPPVTTSAPVVELVLEVPLVMNVFPEKVGPATVLKVPPESKIFVPGVYAVTRIPLEYTLPAYTLPETPRPPEMTTAPVELEVLGDVLLTLRTPEKEAVLDAKFATVVVPEKVGELESEITPDADILKLPLAV